MPQPRTSDLSEPINQNVSICMKISEGKEKIDKYVTQDTVLIRHTSFIERLTQFETAGHMTVTSFLEKLAQHRIRCAKELPRQAGPGHPLQLCGLFHE